MTKTIPTKVLTPIYETIMHLRACAGLENDRSIIISAGDYDRLVGLEVIKPLSREDQKFVDLCMKNKEEVYATRQLIVLQIKNTYNEYNKIKDKQDNILMQLIKSNTIIYKEKKKQQYQLNKLAELITLNSTYKKIKDNVDYISKQVKKNMINCNNHWITVAPEAIKMIELSDKEGLEKGEQNCFIKQTTYNNRFQSTDHAIGSEKLSPEMSTKLNTLIKYVKRLKKEKITNQTTSKEIDELQLQMQGTTVGSSAELTAVIKRYKKNIGETWFIQEVKGTLKKYASIKMHCPYQYTEGIDLTGKIIYNKEITLTHHEFKIALSKEKRKEIIDTIKKIKEYNLNHK